MEKICPSYHCQRRSRACRSHYTRSKKQGIYIAEDPKLLSALAKIDIDQEIPEELFTAVAVILSWAYWLKEMEPGDEKKRNLKKRRSLKFVGRYELVEEYLYTITHLLQKTFQQYQLLPVKSPCRHFNPNQFRIASILEFNNSFSTLNNFCCDINISNCLLIQLVRFSR